MDSQTCLRVYNGNRSLWTLYGLAVRSAQSIGLHRDGRNLKISPFDTEIRRRLWWNISSADSRAAEDHGISLTEQASDTQYPSNIDDRDLFPDMQELPVQKQRWTEMTFPLVIIETSRVLQQLYQTPATSSSGVSNEASRMTLVNNLRDRFDNTYLKQCDPNIPIQQATLLMSRMMSEKLSFIIRLQSLKRSDFENNTSGAMEETLNAACQILDYHLQLQLDGLLGNFHWLTETFAQYHMLTYVLWHLCERPVGPSVARAWNVVEQSFEIASRRDISAEVGSKWEVLEWLKEKAVRVRDAQNMGLSMANTGGTDDMSELHNLNAESNGNPDLGFGDTANWDMAALGFPDWNNPVGNFDMGGFDV